MATKKKRKTNAGNVLAFVLMFAVLGGILLHYRHGDGPTPAPGPNNNVIPEPTKYRSVVEPIRSVSIPKNDASALAGFYVALGRKIAEDGGRKLTTLRQIRELNAEAGRFCFENTSVYLSYQNLSPHVDNAIGTASGAGLNNARWEEIAINASNSKEISDALLAVAWAVMQ